MSLLEQAGKLGKIALEIVLIAYPDIAKLLSNIGNQGNLEKSTVDEIKRILPSKGASETLADELKNS